MQVNMIETPNSTRRIRNRWIRSIGAVNTAVCLLALLALPGRASATVLNGNVTTPVSVTDQITMNSVTNTAAISTSTGSNPAIFVNGANLIGADVLSTGNWPIRFNPGHDVVQTNGMVQVFPTRSLQFDEGKYVLNNGSMVAGTWFNVSPRGSLFVMNGGVITGNVGVANFSGTTGQGGVDVGGRSQLGESGTKLGTMILSNGVIHTATFSVGRYTLDLINPRNLQGVVIHEAGATVNVVSASAPQANAQDGGTTGASFVISHLNQGSFGVNALESSYTLKGGGLNIPNGHTKIYQYGEFGGYGTVNTTGTRILDMSGQVVANGFGVDRTLDLSQYGVVSNQTDNGTERTGAGWYAINRGKLILPTQAVSAGNSTINWGEAPTDTSIDLVNSLRLAFTNVASGGNLSISLLATDRTDVPPNPFGVMIGVWDIQPSGGFSFGSGSVDLTFRFDDAAAAAVTPDYASRLRVFHYNGTQWQQLTSTVHMATFTITAPGVNSFSLFSLAIVPEPSTALLLGVGGLLVWRRMRRNRAASSSGE